MESPLISVVIPVYNGAPFIAATIDSVFAQNHPSLEIIVVNDGSTDDTRPILEGVRNKITIIDQENQGQAVARNVGLKAARGSLLALLDADDLWTPDHLAVMLPHLETDEYDFVRGLTRYFRNLGTETEEMTGDLFMEALVGACLYKRRVFDIVGYFDEEMRQGEDFDWNIRLAESACKEKRLDVATLLYRRHDNNLTNSQDFVKQGQLNAFRKKIARAKMRQINQS